MTFNLSTITRVFSPAVIASALRFLVSEPKDEQPTARRGRRSMNG